MILFLSHEKLISFSHTIATWHYVRKYRSMNHGSICLYLQLKRFLTQVIHNELITVLNFDTIGSLMIIQCQRKQDFQIIPCQAFEENAAIIIDDTILNAFNKESLSSIRELTKFTYISAPTIRRYLTRSLCFVVK
jgi:hypothetical protein